MKIVGLDLSLTSTGIAVVHDGEIWVARLTSKGSKDATLADRQARLSKLRRDLIAVIGQPDLVVVEGPSFGQARQGGQHDRAGFWWLMVDAMSCPIAEIPPASVKTYATGKGNAAKDQVLAAVVRRYPSVDVSGNDEADALVLAAMGARSLGTPVDTMPQLNLKGMDKVRWPEMNR